MNRVVTQAGSFDSATISGVQNFGASEQFMANLTNGAREYYQQENNFFDRSVDKYSSMKNIIDDLHDKGMQLHENEIYAITSNVGLRSASPYLQKWIMEEPGLKQNYLDGINPYEEYETDDMSVGTDSIAYRQVTDKMLIEEDGRYVVWNHDDDESEDELSFSEKSDILAIYETINILKEAGNFTIDDDDIEYF